MNLFQSADSDIGVSPASLKSRRLWRSWPAAACMVTRPSNNHAPAAITLLYNYSDCCKHDTNQKNCCDVFSTVNLRIYCLRYCIRATTVPAAKLVMGKWTTPWAATAGAAEPTFTAAPVGCELRLFTPVTITDVTKAIQALPDKQCLTDPLPTRLLKTNVDLLAPFLSQLFNWSLEHGVVPSSMNAAYITPIVKKTNMDPTDPKSFRPISNLSVVSKLLERLVCQQLVTYLKINNYLIYSLRFVRTIPVKPPCSKWCLISSSH